MNDIPTRFGFPDTLPPLARRHLRGCFVFAGMGLFVLLLGLFPDVRPPSYVASLLAACCLALLAWGVFKFLKGKPPTGAATPQERAFGTRTQVGLFTMVMCGVGVGFFFWAKHFGVAPSLIIGSLLLIEGVAGVIVSLTEWWRLSHIGVSLGLVAGGFLLPFAENVSVAVPVGGAFLLGSLLSGGILFWQLRHCEASTRKLEP